MKVETEDEMLENETAVCRMCAQPRSSVATSSPTPTLTYQLLHYFGIMVSIMDQLKSTHTYSQGEVINSKRNGGNSHNVFTNLQNFESNSWYGNERTLKADSVERKRGGIGA